MVAITRQKKTSVWDVEKLEPLCMAGGVEKNPIVFCKNSMVTPSKKLTAELAWKPAIVLAEEFKPGVT